MPNLKAHSTTIELQRPPPGTRTLMHDKPHNRGIWEPNGQEVWYVRTAMIHYRCLKSYIPNTASECVSEMTGLLLDQNNFPSLLPVDTVTRAAAEIMDALQNPAPSIPIPRLGDKKKTDLKQLVAIFKTAVPQSP